MKVQYSITIDANVLISQIITKDDNTQVCLPMGIKPTNIVITVDNVTEEQVVDLVKDKIEKTEQLWLS